MSKWRYANLFRFRKGKITFIIKAIMYIRITVIIGINRTKLKELKYRTRSKVNPKNKKSSNGKH